MNDVGKPWTCSNRACGATADAPAGAIPKGWIGIRSYPGDREERPKNLGIFCSLICAGVAINAMRERVA